jgi:hypothetical protein
MLRRHDAAIWPSGITTPAVRIRCIRASSADQSGAEISRRLNMHGFGPPALQCRRIVHEPRRIKAFARELIVIIRESFLTFMAAHVYYPHNPY